MKSVCALVIALFLIVAPIGQIYGRSNGAPPAACSDMTPQHGVAAKDTSSPFSTVLPEGYFAVMGNSVRLELRSTNDESSFKGFLVQAFQKGKEELINGTFSLISDGHPLECTDGQKNAATHDNANPKKLVSMIWTPPATLMGDIVFKTTFVLEKSTFWVKTESKPLTIGHTAPATTGKPEVTTPSTASQAQSTWASFIVISLVAFLMRS